MMRKRGWREGLKGVVLLLALVAGVGAWGVPSCLNRAVPPTGEGVGTVYLVDLSESIPPDVRRGALLAAGLASAVHDHHYLPSPPSTQSSADDLVLPTPFPHLMENDQSHTRVLPRAGGGGGGGEGTRWKSVVVVFGASVVQLPPVPAILLRGELLSRWSLRGEGSYREVFDAFVREQDQAPGRIPAPLARWVQQAMGEEVGREASDLAGALRYARLLLTSSGGPRGRVVLFSDGNHTDSAGEEELAGELTRLAGQGVQVDTVDVWPPDYGDVAVGRLQLPKVVRQGAVACGEVAIRSRLPAQVELALTVNHVPAGSWTLALPEVPGAGSAGGDGGGGGGGGDSRLPGTLSGVWGSPHQVTHHFCTPPIGEGHGAGVLVRMEARVVTGAPDGIPGNNRSGAVVQVLGEPRILLVTDQITPSGVQSGGALPPLIMDLVRGAGCQEQGPATPSGGHSLPCTNLTVAAGSSSLWHQPAASWSPYDLIILDGMAPSSLSHDLAQYLSAHVSRGGGLITLGGPGSYGPGGWGDTPLDKILPVGVDPRSPDVTMGVVYILDKSGSMGGAGEGGQHMLLAKSTLRTLVESLPGDDLAGIIAHDQRAYPLMPLIRAGKFSMDQVDTGSVEAGGSTDPRSAMVVAERWLSASNARVKKIILIGDGKIAPGVELEEVVKSLVSGGIRVSTISVGSDGDQEQMGRIARWGQGQTGSIDTLAQLGRAIGEALLGPVGQLSRSGTFRVLPGPDPLRHGFQVPPISGYVATGPTQNAHLWLTSSEGEPILAGARVGSGRVVSLTTDLHGKWTGPWMNWEGRHHLFKEVGDWVLGSGSVPHVLSLEPVPGGLVQARFDGSWLHGGWAVGGGGEVHSMGSAGSDGADLPGVVRARLVCASGGESGFQPMHQVAPGRYGALFEPCAGELTKLIVRVGGVEDVEADQADRAGGVGEGGGEDSESGEPGEQEFASLHYVDTLEPELLRTGSDLATLGKISTRTGGEGPLFDQFFAGRGGTGADNQPQGSGGEPGVAGAWEGAGGRSGGLSLPTVLGPVNLPLLLLFLGLFLVFVVL